jgi:hypothetical protein
MSTLMVEEERVPETYYKSTLTGLITRKKNNFFSRIVTPCKRYLTFQNFITIQ